MIKEKLNHIKNKIITLIIGIIFTLIGLTSFILMISHLDNLESKIGLDGSKIIMIAASILFIFACIGFELIRCVIRDRKRNKHEIKNREQ